LECAGLGAAGLLGGRLLTGCGGSTPEEDAYEPRPLDPDRPWWLQANYAPVDAEREATEFAVEGAIPPELDGVYMRNGPNPLTGSSEHWFLGDGMLHGVRLRNGKAEWYRNRYVQTRVLGESVPSGGPRSLDANPGNTAIVRHAGKLLALNEAGYPHEIGEDLSTAGVYDFGGSLSGAMTAHPKIDPLTGEMLFFGYGVGRELLTYYQVNSEGELVRTEPISIPAFSMMHDFAVTSRHVIFIDVPIGIDLTNAGSGIPLAWDDDHPTRLGVMPRDGGNGDVVWLEIDQCMIVHTMNAYEDDAGKIILDAARIPELWRGGPRNFQTGSLWRYTIDLASQTVAESQLDDHLSDFPQFSRMRLGQSYRYGYAAHFGEDQGGAPGTLRGVNGILKFDLATGRTQLVELPLGQNTDELFFVAARDGASEDDGYLMGFGHDRRSDSSHLDIYDASAMERVARIHVPVRVPAGFHGMWLTTVPTHP
jgi:carotenoid cleavage dioxygenase